MDDPEHMQLEAGLYIVATPIGNLDDITLRALKILKAVDFIAAEDTRHTARLLSHHRIKGARLISYHDHNEISRTPELIDRIKRGSSVAVVSKAGTPLVSDPGYRLIKMAVANRTRIIPVPGASAAIAALSVSGLPTDSFVFEGFLPRTKGNRIKRLKELAVEKRTLIFYESPRRVLALLKDIQTIMGDRPGVLSREMTKIYEEFIRGRLSAIISTLTDRSGIRGECTLVVMGGEIKDDVSETTLRAEIEIGLQNRDETPSAIAKAVAKKYGLPKSRVYEEVLKIKDGQ
jgi:16S rRNA (cytidine1402-2'-O)-methyltransferase